MDISLMTIILGAEIYSEITDNKADFIFICISFLQSKMWMQ